MRESEREREEIQTKIMDLDETIGNRGFSKHGENISRILDKKKGFLVTNEWVCFQK